MPIFASVTTYRKEAAELRTRAVRLREASRDLVERSRLCRRPYAAMAPKSKAARTAEVAGASSDGRALAEFERLIRAEGDLLAAIAECRAALDSVRQEIRWHDTAGSPLVVH